MYIENNIAVIIIIILANPIKGIFSKSFKLIFARFYQIEPKAFNKPIQHSKHVTPLNVNNKEEDRPPPPFFNNDLKLTNIRILSYLSNKIPH